MAAFSRDVLDAAAKEREVGLITRGRETGKPHRVTIWISTDGKRLYIRSGGGMTRDWPQNLAAAGEAELDLGGKKVKVKARHVTEPDEARMAAGLARAKYGPNVKASNPSEPMTAGEQATFELLPGD